MENLYTAKSAAARAGCDPGTIRRQCTPAARLHSSTGSEFPVYSEAEIDAFVAWTAEHGRGCKHRSRRR